MELLRLVLIPMMIMISLIMTFGVQISFAEEKEVPVFIQPVDLLFDSNDSHVMLYFKDHPQYEAVEAMIKEKNRKTFIRAMLTRHDENNTQMDLINDKSFVDQVIKEDNYRREVYYTPIEYQKTKQEGKIHINLKFVTHKGEQVNFDFHAADEISEKHAGLINPEGHSSDIVLPVMLCEKSTLASPESKISFDGKQYKIPTKVWIPIFFKGMKGYYSENFEMLIFRTGTEEMELISTPEQLEVGEKWIYQTKNEPKIYKIISKEGKRIIIKHRDEKITVQIENNELLIKSIQLSKEGNSKQQFMVSFNPYLPINLQDKKLKEEVEFKISYRDEGLITGSVQVISKNKSFTLKLIPEQPKWAKKRELLTNIINQNNSNYLLKTKVSE